MIDNLVIRQATENDIDFITEGIIESEKSGSNVVSSCKIFGLTEERFKTIIREALLENVPDYDYFLSGFLIAEKDGEYVGSIGSWIEAADETSSGIIKTTMLLPYLDEDTLKSLQTNSCLLKSLTVNREPGALQLEYDYTREEFRRQGIFSRLLIEAILRNMKTHNGIEKVQVALFKANIKSLNAHLKLGFEIVEERHIDDPGIFNFFPYDTKLLLELNKEKISRLKLN
ncbi:MAG: GNAT family N-acetyltransferase [Ignavibacteriaceae bacterium]|nr:GNAT family N-acetyltransferase [Ignavibacteriaceae bacterium]